MTMSKPQIHLPRTTDSAGGDAPLPKRPVWAAGAELPLCRDTVAPSGTWGQRFPQDPRPSPPPLLLPGSAFQVDATPWLSHVSKKCTMSKNKASH